MVLLVTWQVILLPLRLHRAFEHGFRCVTGIGAAVCGNTEALNGWTRGCALAASQHCHWYVSDPSEVGISLT